MITFRRISKKIQYKPNKPTIFVIKGYILINLKQVIDLILKFMEEKIFSEIKI